MKMKFGAIVVDGRGKIGGHVASKNRSGAYLRTKVTPVNPSSVAQNEARNRLTEFAQGWRDLTADQRAAWNGAVNAFAGSNVFGDIKNPSGFNLYVGLNSTLLSIGYSALTLPPVPSAVAIVNVVELTSDVSVPLLQLTMSDTIPVTSAMVVRAAAPSSPGKSFFKSELRNIQVVTPTGTPAQDLTDAFVAKFGSIGLAGQKIAVELFFVDTATGIRSATQFVTVVSVP